MWYVFKLMSSQVIDLYFLFLILRKPSFMFSCRSAETPSVFEEFTSFFPRLVLVFFLLHLV